MSEHDHQAAVVSQFKAKYPQYKDCIMAIPNGQMLGGRNKFAAMNKLMYKMGYEAIWAAGVDIAMAAIDTYMFERPEVNY